jgi:hypothetical protein
MKKFIAIILISLPYCSMAQERSFLAFENAFLELRGMLSDSIPSTFKRAVFLTENAYYGDRLRYEDYEVQIAFLTKLCFNIAKEGDLIYSESDKSEVEKYASIFRLMKDTVTFLMDNGKQFKTSPFSYDFDDFFGEKDWSKMFVTKLLASNKGNCHSLPFLYKILCEEMGAKAYLAMAPNHIYIKHWAKKTGWFNTELTSGQFPIDAWIMASGYVHLSAVQNRVFMDTLSQKQSLAITLIDLAKGYERKFGSNADLDFIMKCADLTLEYYPLYVNALILKAETMKKKFEKLMILNKAEYPSDLFNVSEAKSLFDQMQNLYLYIHQIGYRQMPKDMYVNWLAELKREKEKYANKEIKNLKIETSEKN